MLTVPMEMIADHAYWFEQVSAPAGYEPMEKRVYDVVIGPDDGFVAVEDYFPIAIVPVVINKTTDGKPVVATPSTGTPSTAAPKTGDGSQPMLWSALCLLALLGMALMKFGWQRKSRTIQKR